MKTMETNVAFNQRNWVQVLSDFNSPRTAVYIDVNKPWYKTRFKDFLHILSLLPVNQLKMAKVPYLEYQAINWSFLEFSRYNDDNIFNENSSLLQNGNFLAECYLRIEDPLLTQSLTPLFFDYYRRYIPFFYGFYKIMKVHHTCSLDLKVPYLELFFSSFGDIEHGVFNKQLPFKDETLLNLLNESFDQYCVNRVENRFGNSMQLLKTAVKGLAEYLKIISTLNMVDMDLVVFLEDSFLFENYPRYKEIFGIAKELFPLNNVSWVYTKAYQMVR